MPLGVDGEPVPAERIPHRPGLDAGQIDAASAELLEHAQQGARAVVGELDEQRGLIGAGGLADPPGSRDLDETGHGVGVVGHAPGQHVQTVLLGGQRVAQDRLIPQGLGVRGAVGLRKGARRRGGGGAGDVARLGQVLVDPAAALRPGVGVGGDGAHVVERGAGAPGQHEGDRHGHLGGDDERRTRHEVVEGRVDPALHRVLDGDDGGFGGPVAHAIQSGGNVLAGVEDDVVWGDLPQRHFAEGAGRPQEGPGGSGVHGAKPKLSIRHVRDA